MDCTKFLNRYSDYDDSLLPPAEASLFRRHLRQCPSCARYDRVLRKGRMLARQLPRPDPSPDFLPRLQRRLWRAGRRGHAGWGRSRPRAVPAAALAFVTVLAATAAGLWLLTEPGATWARGGGEDDLAGAGGVIAAQVPPRTPAMGLPWMAIPPGDEAGDWTSPRVAHRVASSYSPLVTGPPAYRAGGSITASPTRTTRSTLD